MVRRHATRAAWFLAAALALAGPASGREGAAPPIRTGSVVANGIRFSYLEAGTGPLVLALHGFPDLPTTFRHQMRALAAAGYRVVAPYMRGYPPTEAPADASYDTVTLAQDAVALIDALRGGPATLLGHDWGTVAAYGAAILAPEKVARLVAIAIPRGPAFRASFVVNPEQQRRSWYIFFFQMPYAEAAIAYDDFAFVERLWQDWSPGWTIPADEIAAVKATFRDPKALAAALNYYRHTFGPTDPRPDLEPLRARMGEPIRVPTLYLHGERDGGIGVETTAGMEQAFAGPFEKHLIAGAGHFVHQEKPEEVNRLLLAFLGRPGAGGARAAEAARPPG
jgi:pimeloyl-ACP methyl ester carboxylesterase